MTSEMRWKKRRAVVVGLVLLIAVAHIFRLGSYLPGQLYNYYYTSDVKSKII